MPPQKGFFIPLSSENALQECLETGLYGQLMKPKTELSRHHLNILADYASANPGDHIFFFTNRQIYYGGQLNRSTGSSTVYFNSPHNPFNEQSELVFAPKRFDADENGVFQIETRNGVEDRCQPYLLSFTDRIQMKGANIRADKLYNILSQFSFPVQSNTISGKGFTAITPGETNELIKLLRDSTHQAKLMVDKPNQPGLKPFDFSQLGTIDDAICEAGVEAVSLAEPSVLPEYSTERTYIRQVPMSAFKPSIDCVDIGAYTENKFFPETVYELKYTKAGKSAAKQAQRYIKWADQLPENSVSAVHVYAPSITESFFTHINREYKDTIQTHEFKPRDLNNYTLKQSV